MSQLVIRGHATRGKEVIEILKMLGGNNANNCYNGNYYDGGYYINENGYIDQDFISHIEVQNEVQNTKFIIYTLEQFEEKFPYKVGDKVQYKKATSCGSVFEVEKIRWVNNHIQYTVKGLWYNDCHSIVTAEDLQPFEEETMKDKKINQMSLVNCDLDEVEIVLGDNFEIILKNGKYYAVRKKPKYPKDYGECCELLSLGEDGRLYTAGYKASLIQDFQKLLICRDAYWKMARDWKPDWSNLDDKYTISVVSGDKILLDTVETVNTILAFPTAEMRDAFYENFKKSIEQCKEVL